LQPLALMVSVYGPKVSVQVVVASPPADTASVFGAELDFLAAMMTEPTVWPWAPVSTIVAPLVALYGTWLPDESRNVT
jgi:hypothetical protein